MDVAKLKAMKVADLKAELDKRGLAKCGTKAVLVERLSKAMTELGVEVGDGSTVNEETTPNVEPATTDDLVGADDELDYEQREELDFELREEDEIEISEPAAAESVEETEGKSSVLGEESNVLDPGIDDLDYGDDDNKPEDIVSFQIDESEALIVEDNPKVDISEGAKATPAKKVNEKVDTKPSDDKSSSNKTPKVEPTKAKAEDEGHPDILKMVWISNLTKHTRALDLKTTFGQYGKVMSAKVVMNPNAKEAKCFGLVTMSKESEADTAISKLNGYKLHDKEIVVEPPKKDNAVLRKMRQQLQAAAKKPTSRPAGIRPRHNESPDKKPEVPSRSDRDKDRRVVAGSGSNTVISVNIKTDDKSGSSRRDDRNSRRRSRSPGRRPSRISPSKRPSRRSSERPPGGEKPKSPIRRRSRSPRPRRSRSPRRRSPRRVRSPSKRSPSKRSSPRRRSRSPKRARSPRRSPRRRSPERRVHDPRRSPARRPERRRSSRSPKRVRRSPSPALRTSQHRSERRSRSAERRVNAGRKTAESESLELKLLREQTAKQEAAIKALMQGNVANVGQMLGAQLTEKLAADLKSALVKQLQSTVKTMSTKGHSKNALTEAQHAANAHKIKENLEKMKANGQVTTLLPQTRPAPPIDAVPAPVQTLPKYNATTSLPSFNPLMVSHKQPESGSTYNSSQHSSSGRDHPPSGRPGRDHPRDTFSRSSDRQDPRHPAERQDPRHPAERQDPRHPAERQDPRHPAERQDPRHPAERQDPRHPAERQDPRHAAQHPRHAAQNPRHLAQDPRHPGSGSRSSLPGRADTYSRADPRSGGGQQSTQINDLLKSLQGVKEMVSKPNTYANVQPPQPHHQVQPQTYKNVNPMMQPPPNHIPPQGPRPQQYGNMPMNFNPQNPSPQQWGQRAPFSSAPPFMTSQNSQFNRR